MEKVRPWCGQPLDRGRLKNRTALFLFVFGDIYRAPRKPCQCVEFPVKRSVQVMLHLIYWMILLLFMAALR